MGFLKVNKSTPSHSQIIYTDNVRRKSSFSLIITIDEKKEIDLKKITKHIATFEETADSKHGSHNYTIGRNGTLMEVAELCANFVSKESSDGKDETTKIPISRTHKWLVFASAFFILAMDMGLLFSFGTLFPAILEKFGDNRASTAAIQSLSSGIGPSSAILTGVVCQMFGPRKCGFVGGIMFSSGFLVSFFATSTVYLQLSYGVVTSLGYSLLFISSNQVVSQIFTGHARVTCLSALALGPGVGGIVYPYLLKWLTDTFGLNGTFLLLGGIVTNTVPLTILWSTSHVQRMMENQENSTEKTKQKGRGKTVFKNIIQTVKYKPFLFQVFGLGLCVSSIAVFVILIMDILMSNGLRFDDGITTMTVMNAVSLPARLIPGFCNNIKSYNTLMTPILTTLSGAAGMLLLTLVPSFSGSIIAAGFIGFSRGCGIASMSVVTITLLDDARFPTGLGLIYGLIGFLTTVMGPVYAFLRGLKGSYTIPLGTMTMVFLAGFLLCSTSMILYNRIKAQKKRERPTPVFTVTRL